MKTAASAKIDLNASVSIRARERPGGNGCGLRRAV
eukprot:COSAG02_NODE_48192_length_335_cov_1.093220_2_plen_34_part_01